MDQGGLGLIRIYIMLTLPFPILKSPGLKAWRMHLVGGLEGRLYPRSYHSRQVLTRPDSLQHVFRKPRIHRNLTKRTLAEMFSVSERYVSDVENGSRFPSLRFCLKSAELYGANPCWVKNVWAKEAIERFTGRLLKRLKLEP